MILMLSSLNNAQTKRFSEILADVGKLFFASLVIGYFIPEFKIAHEGLVLGFALSGLSFIFSISLLKKIENI